MKIFKNTDFPLELFSVTNPFLGENSDFKSGNWEQQTAGQNNRLVEKVDLWFIFVAGLKILYIFYLFLHILYTLINTSAFLFFH